MSLWTPSGEHPVDRSSENASNAAQSAAPGEPGEPSLDDLTPEQRAEAEAMAQQMAEAQAQVLDAPAGVVIAQNALAFYELAGLYLSQDPPRLEDARCAIDALQAIADKLDTRLGEARQPVEQALNQAQVVYVQVAGNQETQED